MAVVSFDSKVVHATQHSNSARGVHSVRFQRVAAVRDGEVARAELQARRYLDAHQQLPLTILRLCIVRNHSDYCSLGKCREARGGAGRSVQAFLCRPCRCVLLAGRVSIVLEGNPSYPTGPLISIIVQEAALLPCAHA